MPNPLRPFPSLTHFREEAIPVMNQEPTQDADPVARERAAVLQAIASAPEKDQYRRALLDAIIEDGRADHPDPTEGLGLMYQELAEILETAGNGGVSG